MKSPTKQDFIDENQEEGIEIQRKIRVKILDPDATESSSDDEQEKRPKFIVHEIIQEKVKIQSFSQKNKDPFDFYQFSGKLPPMIRKRRCGKFATEEMLKVVKNAKEAISAKSEMVDSQTSDLSKVKTRFDQFCGKLPPMVRKRKSGKFSTEIRDPFSKKRIWLGTFHTAEEASEVYQSKKLEFEKLKKAKNANVKKAISAKSFDTAEEASEVYRPKIFEFEKKLKKAKNANVKKAIPAKSEIGSSSKKSLSFDHFSGKLPPMVRKRKSGKFSTEIRDPFSKKRIWLGTFDTAEEASEVYQSKKLEFEKLKKVKNANVKKAISAKFELGSFSSDPPLMVHSQTSDSSNDLDDRLMKPINANVKLAISAKSEFEYSSSCDLPLMVDSQTSDSSNEFDERLKMAINTKERKAISAKLKLGSSSSSDQPSIVDSQTSESSNGQESEEEMWMGQWIRISAILGNSGSCKSMNKCL